MELQILNNQNGVSKETPIVKDVRFIESNTQAVSLDEIKNKHLVPVFVKDNTPLISQAGFITHAREIVEELSGHISTSPGIKVSHPIKGRIFEARNKKAHELLDHEKTIYYERLAWISEIPAITENVNGQTLSLCFGGVKAYNLDKLNSKMGANQHFKFFIGFKVKVCTNLCIWTDGFAQSIKARNTEELFTAISKTVNEYNSIQHLKLLNKLSNYELSEQDFATLLGKTRMYNHLPKSLKKEIPEFLISDSQISSMTKAYYSDDNFCRNTQGNINLWNLYNLFTGSVKSSYIDSFLDRNVNAFDFVHGVARAMDGDSAYRWFLN